jgi:hypothetical protein
VGKGSFYEGLKYGTTRAVSLPDLIGDGIVYVVTTGTGVVIVWYVADDE